MIRRERALRRDAACDVGCSRFDRHRKHALTRLDADALFDFSRPVTGGYYWGPPLVGRPARLTALGL